MRQSKATIVLAIADGPSRQTRLPTRGPGLVLAHDQVSVALLLGGYTQHAARSTQYAVCLHFPLTPHLAVVAPPPRPAQTCIELGSRVAEVSRARRVWCSCLVRDGWGEACGQTHRLFGTPAAWDGGTMTVSSKHAATMATVLWFARRSTPLATCHARHNTGTFPLLLRRSVGFGFVFDSGAGTGIAWTEVIVCHDACLVVLVTIQMAITTNLTI